MSVFGSIMSKIFGHAVPSAQAATPAPGSAPAAPSGFSDPGAPAASPAAAAPASPAPGSAPSQPVDVAAVLTEMEGKAGQKLNWQTSIVDLMKLLGLDSSLENRKELAKELAFAGDMNDSASMNIWLHKSVMQKLAANGGKVPDDLKG